MSFLLLTGSAFAQIPILNSSFEDSSSNDWLCRGLFIKDWIICNRFSEVFDTAIIHRCYLPEDTFFPSAGLHSRHFLNIQNIDNSLAGTGVTSQRLGCKLESGRLYSFQMFATQLRHNIGPTPSKLEVWLGSDSCRKDQLVYVSDSLPLAWTRLNIEFTPDSNYQYLILTCRHMNYPPQQPFGILAVDSISSIYTGTLYHVHFAIHDTLIAKNQCVHLTAAPTVPFDSVYWLRIHPNGKVDTFGYSQTQLLECPTDSNTIYIVALADSGWSCSGKWWSYDTARVRMQLHTGISDESEDWSGFHIYPNPVRDNLMIQTGRKESYWYSIQDMLGKSYLGGHVQDGALIDVSELPRGIYVVSVGGRVFKLVKD